MKKKETRIRRRRERYRWNRHFILAVTGWDEEEYNNLWLDIVGTFLDRNYPIGDARYATHRKQISGDDDFWNWWLLEWKLREDKFVWMPDNTEGSYIKYMSDMLDDGLFNKSFSENYTYKCELLN